MAVQLRLSPELFLGAVAILLGQHLLGDIKDHAIKPQALASFTEDRPPTLGNPALTAIGVDDPILERIRRAPLERLINLVNDVRTDPRGG